MIYRCCLDITGLSAEMEHMEFRARNYSSQFEQFFCLHILVADITAADADITYYYDCRLDLEEEVSGYLFRVIVDAQYIFLYFDVIPYFPSDSCYYKL